MMASGEEAAELGDADSGLMWKPHNIEVTANIIINIINFEVTFNQRCEMRKSYKYVRVTCFLSVLILGVFPGVLH